MFFRFNFDCWREMLLMLLMAAVLICDLVFFDNVFSGSSTTGAQHHVEMVRNQ